MAYINVHLHYYWPLMGEWRHGGGWENNHIQYTSHLSLCTTYMPNTIKSYFDRFIFYLYTSNTLSYLSSFAPAKCSPSPWSLFLLLTPTFTINVIHEVQENCTSKSSTINNFPSYLISIQHHSIMHSFHSTATFHLKLPCTICH